MSVQTLAFDVPAELYEESVARLAAAGAEDAATLLEAALRASVVDALETAGGVGAVPTALADVRAARLFELCKQRNEIVSDEIVAVLFRAMPTTATAISRRMQATYEAGLEQALAKHMTASARISTPKKDEGADPRYRIVFSTSAAYTYAVKRIAANHLANEVSLAPVSRAIEFPQRLEVGQGADKRKVRIATEVLGFDPGTRGL